MTEGQNGHGGATGIDCSVIVPVLNEEKFIRQAVAAMQRQRFPGTLEFLFADGGSTDRTREVLSELAAQDPRICIFDNPRRYQSSGLNVALRHARGRWIARMDAHAEYPEDYIEMGVSRLQRGGTRWVSGPQMPRGRGPVSRAVTLALASPLGRGGSRKWAQTAHPGDEYELDTGVFVGVWERATLLEYGGWDESSLSNEDSELAGRFLTGGDRLICIPAMGAEYYPRDSLSGLWHQYERYGEYRFKTAIRHPRTLRRSHLLPLAVVLTAAVAGAGPRGARLSARAGLGLWGTVLAADSVRAMPRADPRRDALLMPVVLAVMQLAFGVGAWSGMARNGVPVAALASAAGLDELADALLPSPSPVFAPSLHEDPPVSTGAGRMVSPR